MARVVFTESLMASLEKLVAVANAEQERRAQVRADIRAMFAGLVADKDQGIRVRDRIRADSGKARRVRELLSVIDSTVKFGDTEQETVYLRKDVPSKTYDLVCHRRPSWQGASFSGKRVEIGKRTMKGLLAMLLREGCIS